MEKLLLIDGLSILNRAFYAVPILTNTKGVYTNAIYGFLNIVTKIVDEEKPTHLLVCFDVKKKTFRHEMYEDYKGTRKGMPEELRPQVETIKEVLRKMNISIYEKEGYEADDLLGTLSKIAEKLGVSPVIVSGDKDLLQLATDKIKIKIPKTSKGVTTVKDYFDKDVLEEFSVTPTEFIDLKGLMGDTSDNVPGVPSVGIKTATKIINEFKSIENALENIDNVKPKKAKENLIEFKDQALLSKELVTIITDVDIEFNFEDTKIKDIYNADAFLYFKELELKTYFKRFDNSNNEPVKAVEYEVIENPFDIDDLLDRFISKERVCYNLFIEDDNLVAIALSKDSDRVYVIDVFAGMLDSLTKFFESDTPKVCFNLKDDINFLYSRGISLNSVVMDLSVCSYIVNPSDNDYNYDTLSLEYLGEYQKPIEEILLKGKSKKSINTLTYDEKYSLIATMNNVYYRVNEVLSERIKEKENTKKEEEAEKETEGKGKKSKGGRKEEEEEEEEEEKDDLEKREEGKSR